MRLPIVLVPALMLSACSSIGMPDLSRVAAPFRADADDLSTPRMSEAPERPAEERTGAEWDTAAAELMAEREELTPPSDGDDYDARAVERRMEALKAEARAWQADEPN